MKRFAAFVVCLIGVALPWRLRVIYSELLGWIVQSVYLIYFFVLKHILKSFKVENKKKAAEN